MKSGQTVDFNTPYLEKKLSTNVEIPVAKKLGVAPKHIFRYLKKFIGEKISRGEVLAIKKGFLADSKVICDEEGTIKEIDHDKGTVTLSVPQEENDIVNAFFKGEILEIKKDAVLLKVKKGRSFPLKNATDNFGGEIFYLSGEKSSLSESQIKNKIILAENVNSYLQAKIETLGATGFVLLNKLIEASNLHVAQIKNINDFKKISELNFPYCLIDKENSTIYLYN